MLKNALTYLIVGFLTFVTGAVTWAQTYSNAVIGLNPAGYWPLNETAQPPQPLNLTAVNLGSLGTAGNGYYGAWYQPSGNTWYLTNNIVQTNAITFPFDGSKAMECQRLPGQYVIVPRNTNGVANTGVTLKPPFTIEAWLQIGATNSALGDIISQGGTVNLNTGGANTNNPFYGGLGTGWAGVELGQYQDYLFLMCQSGNAAGNKSSELDTSGYNKWQGFKIGQWVHVVAEFDGTTESIYTNGVLAASKNISGNGPFVADPTTPLMIGAGSDVTADYGIAYQGGIDDVAIYTNTLGTTSIANHYQTAYGTNATFGANYPSAVLADHPVLYYRLNDPQVQTNAGYDTTSFPVANNYGSVGTAGNGVYQPGTTPGVAGPSYGGFGANSKSVAINGWLGAVDVGNSNLPAALNPTNTAPLTVVSWFKGGPADAPGRFQEILGHGDSSYRLAMGQVAGENHFNPGPGPELQFTSAADLATNGFALNDGQWHMVAGVSDGTNEYMYLDGALAKASNNPAGINIAGNPVDLLLGGDSEYTTASSGAANTIRNFDGEIAQVAFWTNALSPAAIQSLYAAAEVPPSIWLQPVSQTNNAGVNVTVNAGVRGSSPLSFQWYQNGSAASGQTNMNLSFSPAIPGNAGNYYLVASNNYGSVTSAVISLVLYGAPTIESQSLTQMHIFAGASPTLFVTAGGAQPLTYQWTSNSVSIPNATNSTYTVSDVQAGATYGCTVHNAYGNAPISAISLSVVSDPTAPYPQQVLADGPMDYYRLDESSGNVAYDYVGGNNATYTNVTLGIPGYNSQATIQSDPSETAAEFGDFPPNDYAGNVPSYVNFSTPNGGNAEFSVEAWFIDYFNGNTNAIVALGYGNGGEQFVLDAGAGAAGGLRFFVRNAGGTVSAANSTYVPGNDGLWHHVVGVCDEAGGHVYLYMDGNLIASGTITAGSGILSSSTPLSIGARQSGNNGGTNYDFQFQGGIDDVSIYKYALTSTQVANHYYASGHAPSITGLQPTNQLSAAQGGGVTVTVTAAGTTPFTYQWKDNNNNVIASATTATLSLTNLQTSQAGTYTVTVGNSYGSASTNFNLAIGSGKPVIAVDLTPTNLTAYSGTIETYSITVSGSSPFAYQWYRDGAPIAGATGHTYTFNVLTGTNTYYCAVTNSFSAGTPTDSSVGTVIGIARSTVNPVSYNSRVKITFSGYNRGEALQDFPVLVRLGTNVAGFSYSEFASPTGADLRFADATGTNELPYEIDEWNPNGISTVWVQVPALSNTNDAIWAYWGNAGGTTPPAYTTNGSVWVPPSFQSLPSYEVVYHLEQGGFPYLDSTLQYSSTNGSAPASATGIVGEAGSFSGGTYLDAGNVSLGNQFTMSAWVNLAQTASNIQGVWVNGGGGYTSAEIALFVNDYNTADGALLLGTGDGSSGQQPETATGVVTTGAWHMLSAVVDRTAGTVQLYVDGSLQGSGNCVNDFPTTNDMNLGRFNTGPFPLDGLIDEARIHSGLDDANWTWASYETVAQNSGFESYSSVTNSTVTLTIQRSGNQVILSWPSGTLQSAPAVNGTYSDMTGITSPYTNTVSGTQQFYRVRVQ